MYKFSKQQSILSASNFLEQYYLIHWPEEDSYSEVPPSKLIEPKKPAVGDKVRVKEGTKVHTGEVVGFGSKAEVEKLMLDLEGQQDDGEDEAATEGDQGKCTFNMFVEHTASIIICFCMYSSTVALFYCLIISAHSCIEAERVCVENQQKAKKGNQVFNS